MTQKNREIETPVYLDHHATTPVDPEVVEAMLPFFTESYGNPASDDHIYGELAKNAVEESRKAIASVINSRKEEIVFTSGATESNNLALKGAAEHAADNDNGSHIVTSAIEHKAVLDTCEYLESRGFDVTYLPVDEYGLVNPADVEDAICEDTILVSIMTANNEIGTIQPIEEIGRITSEQDVYFHTDAAQALAYLPLDVYEMEVDMMSLSAHKAYGPKGIGALYVRRRNPKVKLQTQIHGGGHERGFRSGTLNVPYIVGFAKAAELVGNNKEKESNRVRKLRDRLHEGLKENLDTVILNGHPKKRLPNNLNLSFPSIENKAVVRLISSEVAISAGSACTTDTVEASHVLRAITDEEDRSHSALRFGLGRWTNETEIDLVLEKVSKAIKRLERIA